MEIQHYMSDVWLFWKKLSGGHFRCAARRCAYSRFKKDTSSALGAISKAELFDVLLYVYCTVSDPPFYKAFEGKRRAPYENLFSQMDAKNSSNK